MTTAEKTSPKELIWSEEWVPLDSIIKHQTWQVRAKLDQGAIARYAKMTTAGSTPPPILVGRLGKRLYLLDGWHRMASGALQLSRGMDGEDVLVKVATMDRAQAQWEAAKANMGHGVQLKSKELHEVFKAFVKAKKYLKADGSTMSYRDIAPCIGKPHTTIRTWMLRYFPKLATAMGGMEHGNPEAQEPPLPNFAEEHLQASRESLLDVTQRLDLLTPEGRWQVAKELERALAGAQRLGLQEPGSDTF